MVRFNRTLSLSQLETNHRICYEKLKQEYQVTKTRKLDVFLVD